MSRKKRGGDSGEPTAPFWMMTYGDVMTLLLTFFVLLLSFSSIQEAKFQEAIGALAAAFGVLNKAEAVLDNPNPPVSSEDIDVEDIATQVAEVQEVVEVLKEVGLDNQFDVVSTTEGYAVRISSPVLFDLASADLKEVGKEALARLTDHLSKEESEMRIEGHTDNVPINTPRFPSNWELSTARALSVLKFMRARGLEPTRLSAAGYGEFRPILDNDTQAHRDVNRRVEIYVNTRSQEDRIIADDLPGR